MARYKVTVGDCDKTWDYDRFPGARKWANDLSKHRHTTARVIDTKTGIVVYEKDYVREPPEPPDPDYPFTKVNADGTPKTCKFCHQSVWWHGPSGRWYNVGGQQLHVETCEKGAAFYKSQALDAAESCRQRCHHE